MNLAMVVAAHPAHFAESLMILATAALVFAVSVFQFAHARLQSADPRELENLYIEGTLYDSGSVVEDFVTVSDLLNEIAPAVYVRQEVWIRAYFCALRLARRLAHSSEAVEDELSRLTAYQAANYRLALTRMAAFRSQ